jgi:hypothetical protein
VAWSGRRSTVCLRRVSSERSCVAVSARSTMRRSKESTEIDMAIYLRGLVEKSMVQVEPMRLKTGRSSLHSRCDNHLHLSFGQRLCKIARRRALGDQNVNAHQRRDTRKASLAQLGGLNHYNRPVCGFNHGRRRQCSSKRLVVSPCSTVMPPTPMMAVSTATFIPASISGPSVTFRSLR